MVRFVISSWRMIVLTLCFFLFIIVFGFVNALFNLGINFEHVYNMSFSPAYLFICFLVIMPSLWSQFKKHLLNGNDIVKVISLSVVLGILLNFAMDYIRFMPLLFDGKVIDVAKGQYTATDDFPKYLNFLFSGLFAGFNEEFMFRFLTYCGLFLFLSTLLHPFPYNLKEFMKKKNNKNFIFTVIDRLNNKMFIEGNKVYIFSWILFVSILFACAHQPNLSNFYLYFIGGIINGYLFIRYGFISCVLCHAAYNTFSPINHSIILNLFMPLMS